MSKLIKTKKCKVCKLQFTPARPLQSVCSPGCAYTKVSKLRIKTEKEAYKIEKERIKSRSDWAREAQAAFNAWRRTQDGIERGGKCISCGTTNGKQNAGHYRSVGSSPELRFEPLNVWLQCEKCNTYLHSNAIEFRIALLKIIGQEKLDWLEGSHSAKKYTIQNLKEIKHNYLALYKELKNRV